MLPMVAFVLGEDAVNKKTKCLPSKYNPNWSSGTAKSKSQRNSHHRHSLAVPLQGLCWGCFWW